MDGYDDLKETLVRQQSSRTSLWVQICIAGLISISSLRTACTVQNNYDNNEHRRSASSSPGLRQLSASERLTYLDLGIPLDNNDGQGGGGFIPEGVVPHDEFYRYFKDSTEMMIFENLGQPEEKPDNIWEDSDILPNWMKGYFTWHRDVRKQLDENNWQNYRYMIVRCVGTDPVCAGASDRLKMVPVHILLAAQTKRLLLYYWTRPAPLEEFLIPPEGGLDWRLPAWLAPKLNVEDRRPLWQFNSENIQASYEEWHNRQEQVIRTRRAVQHTGPQYYEYFRNKETEGHFWDVYHTVWKTVFIPSPPVQAIIDQNLRNLNLQVDQYMSVHVRALYTGNTVEKHEEINGIHCAAELAGDRSTPIYFASDSQKTTQLALDYAKSQNLPVVARHVTEEPLHLDRGNEFLSKSHDWKGRPASDFYDTFVDLYLLAGSKCLSHGAGGYGIWTGMIGTSVDCKINHRRKKCAVPSS